ncbi:MAG: hypothetical protein ACOX4M_00590 [Acetivibrionales bacterium]|jgi:hypothetical protein
MGKSDHAAGMARPAVKKNIIYLAAGWMAVILSLVKYPFVFGAAAVAAAVMAGKNSSGRAAVILVISSIVCTGIGLIFSNDFYNYLKLALGI